MFQSRMLFFSCVWLFAIACTAACQAPLSFTMSHSLLRFMPIQLVTVSNHLILCCFLFLLSSIFPSIRVFPNESALCIRWSKYWSFSFTKSQTKLKWLSCFMHACSFSISPSNEYLGLISFRIDWFDLLDVQETLKSLLQHQNSKNINCLVLSLLYGSTLTTAHDWKNHSFDYMDLCWQSYVCVYIYIYIFFFFLSHSVMSDSMWPHGL